MTKEQAAWESYLAKKQEPPKHEPLRCFSCHGEIADVVVWMGETFADGPAEYPFHDGCTYAYPLAEVRREPVSTLGGDFGGGDVQDGGTWS